MTRTTMLILAVLALCGASTTLATTTATGTCLPDSSFHRGIHWRFHNGCPWGQNTCSGLGGDEIVLKVIAILRINGDIFLKCQGTAGALLNVVVNIKLDLGRTVTHIGAGDVADVLLAVDGLVVANVAVTLDNDCTCNLNDGILANINVQLVAALKVCLKALLSVCATIGAEVFVCLDILVLLLTLFLNVCLNLGLALTVNISGLLGLVNCIAGGLLGGLLGGK